MRTLFLGLISVAVWGQQLDLSSLDKLADKAEEAANVSLDEAKLKMASQFLSSDDKDQSKAKSVLSGVRAIHVRAFEFKGPGHVTAADLEAVRQQLKGPGWSRMVEVKGKGELVEVYIFSKGGVPDGLAVIAMEPDELAVVNLIGTVDLKSLMKMDGLLGIPNVNLDQLMKSGEKAGKDDEDDN